MIHACSLWSALCIQQHYHAYPQTLNPEPSILHFLTLMSSSFFSQYRIAQQHLMSLNTHDVKNPLICTHTSHMCSAQPIRLTLFWHNSFSLQPGSTQHHGPSNCCTCCTASSSIIQHHTKCTCSYSICLHTQLVYQQGGEQSSMLLSANVHA